MKKDKKDPKKNQELPVALYIYRYEDGEDSWLSVEEKLADCATGSDVRIVGVYGLLEKRAVRLDVVVTDFPAQDRFAACHVRTAGEFRASYPARIRSSFSRPAPSRAGQAERKKRNDCKKTTDV